MMTPTCSNTVLIKSLDYAYQIMRYRVSYLFVMRVLVADTLHQRKQLPRCCNVVFIGPYYLKMYTSFVRHVTHVNVLEL